MGTFYCKMKSLQKWYTHDGNRAHRLQIWYFDFRIGYLVSGPRIQVSNRQCRPEWLPTCQLCQPNSLILRPVVPGMVCLDSRVGYLDSRIGYLDSTGRGHLNFRIVHLDSGMVHLQLCPFGLCKRTPVHWHKLPWEVIICYIHSRWVFWWSSPWPTQLQGRIPGSKVGYTWFQAWDTSIPKYVRAKFQNGISKFLNGIAKFQMW